jgi:hypothetical protein
MALQNPKRTRLIGLRLTSEEYHKIERACSHTTCRKLSEYVRRVLFHRPITVLQRNASLDDFMTEMMVLRTDLNRATQHCENTASSLRILAYVHRWEAALDRYEKDQQQLLQTVLQIHHRLNQIADQWLQ